MTGRVGVGEVKALANMHEVLVNVYGSQRWGGGACKWWVYFNGGMWHMTAGDRVGGKREETACLAIEKEMDGRKRAWVSFLDH